MCSGHNVFTKKILFICYYFFLIYLENILGKKLNRKKGKYLWALINPCQVFFFSSNSIDKFWTRLKQRRGKWGEKVSEWPSSLIPHSLSGVGFIKQCWSKNTNIGCKYNTQIQNTTYKYKIQKRISKIQNASTNSTNNTSPTLIAHLTLKS